MDKTELRQVKQLIKKASRGLQFKKETIEQVSEKLLNMHQLSESRKLLTLLDVLVTLSEDENCQFMTSKDYAYNPTQDEGRMNKINQYVSENFAEKITIADVDTKSS